MEFGLGQEDGGIVWNTLKGGAIGKRGVETNILKRGQAWLRGGCLKRGGGRRWNYLTNYAIPSRLIAEPLVLFNSHGYSFVSFKVTSTRGVCLLLRLSCIKVSLASHQVFPKKAPSSIFGRVLMMPLPSYSYQSSWQPLKEICKKRFEINLTSIARPLLSHNLVNLTTF